MDVLKEMSRITRELEVKPKDLPHFTTVCHNIQDISNKTGS
ncbi:MAG: hypothetical protein ABEK59_08790 [Halobacteria archaeon]